MKLIILAVLGLLVGLGGGSAAAVMKAKKAFAAETAARAKIVADSLAKVEEGAKAKTQSAEAKPDSAQNELTPEGEAASTEIAKGATHTGEAPKSERAKGAPKGRPLPSSTGQQLAAKVSEKEVPSAAIHDDKPTKSAAPAEFDKTKWNRAVATVESHGSPAGDATTAKPHLPPLPPKPIAAPATAATTPPPSTAKVAKIFAAMPAKDAAKVMEQLDDADVQVIIASVSEKQAAAILQNFPPARAATISKAVMRSALVKP